MQPREYTGKSDATQGAVPDARSPDNGGSTGPDPVADAGRGRDSAAPAAAPRGGLPRAVLWTAVVVALAAGVALYFRYERVVSPLFGGGH